MCSKVVVVVWDMYVGPHSAQAFTQYTRTYMIYVRAPHSILCELTWRSVDTHCGAFYSSVGLAQCILRARASYLDLLRASHRVRVKFTNNPPIYLM